MIAKVCTWGSAAAVLLLLGVSSASADPGPAAACPAAACPAKDCHKPCCIPHTETIDVVRRRYGDICEPFCVPKCTLGVFWSGLFRGWEDDCKKAHEPEPLGYCDKGCCDKCEKYKRKYLVLYIRHRKECVRRCEVDHPCPCPDGACPAHPVAAPAKMAAPPAPAPKGEPIPPATR